MKSFKLIVAYPQPKDASAFEKIYQQEHVPMAVANLPGKTKMVATKILQSPQSEPQFYASSWNSIWTRSGSRDSA